MEKKVKTIPFEIKDINEKDRTFLAVASTETIDRDNDRIMSDGWDLANFKKNPVIPWAHRYSDPPVAQATEIKIADKQLVFQAKFATKEDYPFADTIFNLYKGGFLRSFSVGFMPKRWEQVEREKGMGNDFLEQELWEISACTVPSNPEALIAAKAHGVITDADLKLLTKTLDVEKIEPIVTEPDDKGISGSKDLPINDKGSWDATAASRRVRSWAGGPDKDDVDWKKYGKCFVWVNPEDKESFGGYKLPFADIMDGKATAVWGGVHNAMAAVLGARGGVNLSDDQRQQCYNFLKGYYKKFDKPAPDFREIDLLELQIELDKLKELTNNLHGILKGLTETQIEDADLETALKGMIKEPELKEEDIQDQAQEIIDKHLAKVVGKAVNSVLGIVDPDKLKFHNRR